jgi:MFS transporter, AAHS family, 4-hydroxybenzoate transporter
MQVSIESIINHKPLGPYRIAIVAICFLIVLTDGFDTQAIGFAALAISKSLHIPISDFGVVFSAGLFGSATGALLLGPLGDRIGRRRALVISIATFSTYTLVLPHLKYLPEICICRFVTGLGLGGALPNLIAFCAEYTPRSMRGVVTGVLFAGFPSGGVIGALVGAHFLPVFGWTPIFYIGGSVPLLLAFLVMFTVPEPLEFVLQRRNGQRQVAEIARRIAPWIPPAVPTVYVDNSQTDRNLPLLQVFSTGGGLPTLMLWCSSFMCFAILIVLALWTPSLLREQGVDEVRAALVVVLFNLGSIAGTGIGGTLLDRFPPRVGLPVTFIAGALCVTLIGHVSGAFPLLALFATLTGAFIGAGSAGLLGLSVLVYPSAMRAAGIGWVMAAGRLGQIFGPMAIGAFLAEGISVDRTFLFIGVSAIFAAIAALLLCRSDAISLKLLRKPIIVKA